MHAAQRSALEPQAERREACRLKAQVGPPTPFARSAPGYPARFPTRPPLARLLSSGRKIPLPSVARCQRRLRLGLPTACGLPTAGGIARSADRPDGLPPAPTPATPPAPARRWASPRREWSTSGRPATPPAHPSRNAHYPHSHRLPSRLGPRNRALCPNAPRAPFRPTPGLTSPPLPASQRRPLQTLCPNEPRALF